MKKEVHLLPRQLQSTHKPDLEGSTCPSCPSAVSPFIPVDEKDKIVCSPQPGFRLLTGHLPSRDMYLAHCISLTLHS